MDNDSFDNFLISEVIGVLSKIPEIKMSNRVHNARYKPYVTSDIRNLWKLLLSK